MKIIAVLLILIVSKSEQINRKPFPEDFLFGISSSALQIEGSGSSDGKGETMWDYFAHNYPDKIKDGSNLDIASDSYHKTKEDVQLLKKLGVQFYRFSINWARILPTGFANNINQAGIDYYSDLIDELLFNGITPLVTIYHWELPQTLSMLGGFTNEAIASWMEDYARILFEQFGTRVKFWITINEPRIMCEFGYGIGVFAPGHSLTGIADYACEHNVLRAHAKIYRLYEKHFKATQQGRIGIAIDFQWYEPSTESVEDIEAARREIEFNCGRYLHPIFTIEGDYPKVLKERVKIRSEREGYSKSRLFEFTLDEIESLKGSSDFLGINHYSTFLVRNNDEGPLNKPSQLNDVKSESFHDPSWEGGSLSLFKTVPWGFRKVLKFIKDNYVPVDIYITENGYPDIQSLNDNKRVNYHELMLSTVLDSIYEDEVSVKGYSVWSFMDSFEWNSGYTIAFGIYYVNFSDPNRPRTPKISAKYYEKVVRDRSLIAKDEL